MVRKTIVLISAFATLSACGGGGTTSAPAPITVAPPTAASGYATASSDLTDPDETITRTVELQDYIEASGTNEQRSYTVTISATGNEVNGRNEWVMTFDGVPVTLQWDPSEGAEGAFTGINGDMEIIAYPWLATENGQATLSWITVFGEPGGHGLQVGGFNTHPDVVSARTGPASYIGYGGVSVIAQDDSFWAVVDGEAEITANFDTGAISGTIILTQSNGYGGLVIPDTSLTLNEMQVNDNTFSGTASIDEAAFGLSDVGLISVDGMFYEADATAVGGALSGVGTASVENGGGTVLLNGAFLADE